MAKISLENRLAVYELIARYSHEVDNYRGEGWADLFLEDGKLLGPANPFLGRQAFINQARSLKERGIKYRHVISNIYLDDDSSDEAATAHAYGVVSEWSVKPAKMDIFVNYRFDVVKRGDQWKFAVVNVDMPYSADLLEG